MNVWLQKSKADRDRGDLSITDEAGEFGMQWQYEHPGPGETDAVTGCVCDCKSLMVFFQSEPKGEQVSKHIFYSAREEKYQGNLSGEEKQEKIRS